MKAGSISGSGRRFNMHKLRFWVFSLLIVFFGCTHAQTIEKKEEIYAPLEASLCNINQKVASHFLVSDIPDGFNAAQYKAAVQEICHANPVCKSQAQEIFDSYGVSARKVDDMFSVMLCDKEMKRKVMEDFSCNKMKVEVQSWKSEAEVPCNFEGNWERIKKENCIE
jgi:hypothetical protein